MRHFWSECYRTTRYENGRKERRWEIQLASGLFLAEVTRRGLLWGLFLPKVVSEGWSVTRISQGFPSPVLFFSCVDLGSRARGWLFFLMEVCGVLLYCDRGI